MAVPVLLVLTFGALRLTAGPEAPAKASGPQPPVRVSDGHWEARIVVGREGYGDLGARFRIWVEAQADGTQARSGTVLFTRR